MLSMTFTAVSSLPIHAPARSLGQPPTRTSQVSLRDGADAPPCYNTRDDQLWEQHKKITTLH